MTSASVPDSVAKINREFEERAAAQNARKWGFEYVDIARYPINPDVLRFVPEEKARGAGLLPFDQSGKKLRVAVFDPNSE